MNYVTLVWDFRRRFETTRRHFLWDCKPLVCSYFHVTSRSVCPWRPHYVCFFVMGQFLSYVVLNQWLAGFWPLISAYLPLFEFFSINPWSRGPHFIGPSFTDSSDKYLMTYWCSTDNIVSSGWDIRPSPMSTNWRRLSKLNKMWKLISLLSEVTYLSLFIYPEYVVLLVIFDPFLSCAIFPWSPAFLVCLPLMLTSIGRALRGRALFLLCPSNICSIMLRLPLEIIDT